MSTLEIVLLLVLTAAPVLGNLIAVVLRARGSESAARVVEAVTPLAVGAVIAGRDAARGPAPAPPKSSTIIPPLPVLCLGAVLAVGCSGSQASDTLDAIIRAVPVVDSSARHLYEASLEACAMSAVESERALCVAHVDATAEPLIDALQAVRLAWCTIVPDGEGC